MYSEAIDILFSGDIILSINLIDMRHATVDTAKETLQSCNEALFIIKRVMNLAPCEDSIIRREPSFRLHSISHLLSSMHQKTEQQSSDAESSSSDDYPVISRQTSRTQNYTYASKLLTNMHGADETNTSGF